MNGQEIFLHEEKSKAQAETVRLLIDHRADVTALDETHQTPLHVAALSGSAETVRLLIERGADITVQDRKKKTPLHLALSKVSLEPCLILFSTGLTQLDSMIATLCESMDMSSPRGSRMRSY